jgi:hypothetical protein
MSKEAREAARKDLKDRELKRVDKADIFTLGLERGRIIAKAAKETLGKQLKNTIQNEGVPAALQYCNIAAYPLIDLLSKSYHASIKRTSLRIRNPEDAPDSLEKILLEAYEYNIENNQPLNENIQEYDSKYLLYTKPIMIEGALCLACHGSPRIHVSIETEDLIKSLYPDDNAMNHSMSDLRGMWSIRLQIKDIVNSIEE